MDCEFSDGGPSVDAADDDDDDDGGAERSQITSVSVDVVVQLPLRKSSARSQRNRTRRCCVP